MKNLHTFRQCVASSHTIFPVPTLFLQAAATDAAIEALARTTTSAQSAAKYENRTHGMAIATNFPNTQPSKASCIVCGCMCVLRCGCALERGLQISLTRGVVFFFVGSISEHEQQHSGTVRHHSASLYTRARPLSKGQSFDHHFEIQRAFVTVARVSLLCCPKDAGLPGLPLAERLALIVQLELGHHPPAGVCRVGQGAGSSTLSWRV